MDEWWANGGLDGQECGVSVERLIEIVSLLAKDPNAPDELSIGNYKVTVWGSRWNIAILKCGFIDATSCSYQSIVAMFCWLIGHLKHLIYNKQGQLQLQFDWFNNEDEQLQSTSVIRWHDSLLKEAFFRRQRIVLNHLLKLPSEIITHLIRCSDPLAIYII